METITHFYLSNYCFRKAENGSLSPAFLSSFCDGFVRSWQALEIVPTGSVMFEINVQHWFHILTQDTTSFCENHIQSKSVFLGNQAGGLELFSCSLNSNPRIIYKTSLIVVNLVYLIYIFVDSDSPKHEFLNIAATWL